MNKSGDSPTKPPKRQRSAASLRILIADDHLLLREGLKQILVDAFGDVEFGETHATQQTLEALAREQWNILILDIFMPGRSGLDVLREARQNYPGLPVLVLSSAQEDQLALRVLKAGASGFLNKQVVAEELKVAVEKLLAGKKYLSAHLVDKMTEHLATPSSLHERLSDREFQVMQMIVSGKSLKEIAGELSVSVKTVGTFHGRILSKLRLQNDVELVHYAIEHQLAVKKSV